MGLLVWLFIAVMLITYGGALALTLGTIYVVLDVAPVWMLVTMFAIWFSINYVDVVSEEQSAVTPLSNRGY